MSKASTFMIGGNLHQVWLFGELINTLGAMESLNKTNRDSFRLSKASYAEITSSNPP
jgi:hypothetical protein